MIRKLFKEPSIVKSAQVMEHGLWIVAPRHDNL
jgi:hypothetical protein